MGQGERHIQERHMQDTSVAPQSQTKLFKAAGMILLTHNCVISNQPPNATPQKKVSMPTSIVDMYLRGGIHSSILGLFLTLNSEVISAVLREYANGRAEGGEALRCGKSSERWQLR